jgi:hypothetical protein
MTLTVAMVVSVCKVLSREHHSFMQVVVVRVLTMLFPAVSVDRVAVAVVHQLHPLAVLVERVEP